MFMKKLITLFVLFFSFCTCVFSQTTIWEENFTYPDGTKVGALNRWSATTVVSPKYFEVRSNEFQANDLDAEQILETETIDISAYSNVSLSVLIKSNTGNLDDPDYIQVYYILNGGPETIFTTNGSKINDFNVTSTTTGLSGSTIKIRIKVLNSASSETYAIDNILIKGTLVISAPEINIIGNSMSISDGDNTPSISDETDFGSIALGSSSDHTFTIQNTGSLTLNLTGTPIVSISGDTAFTILTQPSAASIASGGSDLTFTVRFTPIISATVSAAISISNNDTSEDPYNFTIQGTGVQPFFDSDGDGIFDNIDIDDDNDGIKDDDEELSCRNSAVGTTATYKFLNETFGTGARTTINTTYDATTTYCYEVGTVGTNTGTCPSLSDTSLNDGEYTVGSSAQIASWAAEYWYMGGDHTGDPNGRMALFNASYPPGIFYTANIKGALPNIPITYSFWVLNLDRSDAPGIATRLRPNILVEFRDVNNNVLASISTGDITPTTTGNLAGDWYNFSADLVLNVDEFYVYFSNNETGGAGNDLAIDDILIAQTLCDADSDGVADIFDLDSDNDGIPDVVEAGLGNLSGGTAKIPFPTGWVDANANGMHDAAESNIVLDSDGDGVPNFLDLDSDNDGIFDVDESGAGNTANATYQNGDGDISGNGVGQGPDSDTFRETDTNSDNILEYFSDGILDIYDYFEGGTFSTSYGNINQGSTGIGWWFYVKDSDNDGIPDYIDITSNGVTYDIAATLYANLDVDTNGVIDGNTDTDGDGILDAFDTDNTAFGSPRDLDRKLQLYFDGRNDYADDDAAVLSGLSEATLMAWIKIDATAIGAQVLVGQDVFYLQLKADKKVEVYANGNVVSTITALNVNQWIHVAATYSSANGKLKLYINGEIINSTNISGALPADTSHFTIGRKPDTNSNYFKGYFDEVRVFDKALSENELHKMVYQEIENNVGMVRGSVIPRNVTDYINSTTIHPLDWTFLKRYFRMDVCKDDIIDDLSTASTDINVGARIYNIKVIDVQSAPLPFVTQIGDTTLDAAVDIPSKGVVGTDATTYDWSIVQIANKNITYNANQKHVGLIVNSVDASLNPIEFSIQNDTELNVSWYLLLNGVIDLDGESQLVQGEDSDLDPSSTGYIERDQQGTANSFNYNYWSSSVGPIEAGLGTNNADYTIGNILKDGSVADNGIYPRAINFNTSYAAADLGPSIPITISSYWLYTFNGTSDDYYSWNAIDQNTPLKAGEGFTMKGTSGSVLLATNQNYVFKGKPNNGDITLSISAGNDRLIGNPYASAIDADEFIKDNIKETINSKVGRNSINVFNGALYFWHHFGDENSHILREYVGGYATYTLIGGAEAISIDSRINNNLSTGGKEPERYIPVNQGFFVNAYLPSSLSGTTATVDGGAIIFKNSQRVFQTEVLNGGNGSIFFKTNSKGKKNMSEKETDTRSKIRLVFDSPSGYHRQLLIGADENTSNHFDMGYDAPIVDVANEDMFWMVDNSKFVIQGVPNFNEDQEFPLGLKIKEQGLTIIKIGKLENIDKSTLIYMKDNITGETYNLVEKPFEINLEPGEYLNRFYLTFKSDSTLLVENLEEIEEIDGLHIFMNNEAAELQIQKDKNITISEIKLINYVGQHMKIWNQKLENATITLPIHVASGVYIIQIKTQKGIINKKIIIG
jgi:hypothetical protein